MLRIDPWRAGSAAREAGLPPAHSRTHGTPRPMPGAESSPRACRGTGKGRQGCAPASDPAFPRAEGRRMRQKPGEQRWELCAGLCASNVQNGKRSSLQRETGPSAASAPVCYNPELFALCMTLVLIIYSSVRLDGPSAFQSEAFKPSPRCGHTERSKCFPWDPAI